MVDYHGNSIIKKLGQGNSSQSLHKASNTPLDGRQGFDTKQTQIECASRHPSLMCWWLLIFQRITTLRRASLFMRVRMRTLIWMGGRCEVRLVLPFGVRVSYLRCLRECGGGCWWRFWVLRRDCRNLAARHVRHSISRFAWDWSRNLFENCLWRKSLQLICKCDPKALWWQQPTADKIINLVIRLSYDSFSFFLIKPC